MIDGVGAQSIKVIGNTADLFIQQIFIGVGRNLFGNGYRQFFGFGKPAIRLASRVGELGNSDMR